MILARDICALVATVSLAWLAVWVWYSVTVMIVSEVRHG